MRFEDTGVQSKVKVWGKAKIPKVEIYGKDKILKVLTLKNKHK